jgi:hypothetical protein
MSESTIASPELDRLAIERWEGEGGLALGPKSSGAWSRELARAEIDAVARGADRDDARQIETR